MKIIEGLKQIKMLAKKAEDLRKKISQNSAYLSNETPVYKNQTQQVAEWLQAHSGTLKEILRLRIAIQKTNLQTMVAIDFGQNVIVTKSIAEWVHRRRDLAIAEKAGWTALTDRALREGQLKQSTGELIPVTIVRCYDPAGRDSMVSLFDMEPTIVDSKLEIVNAVTDLVE